MNRRDKDGHIRNYTCAYSARYSKLHTTHVFFSLYTAVNSSAWSILDAFEGRGLHVDECVRHDWLNRASREEGSRKRDDLCCSQSWAFTLDRSTSPDLSSHLHITSSSLIHSLLSLSVLRSGSCVATSHAGSKHQSTLMRDFWLFNHALPQPLFLPV